MDQRLEGLIQIKLGDRVNNYDLWDKFSPPSVFIYSFTGPQLHPFIYILSIAAFTL